MDSITTTPVPASDVPINQGNNRPAMSRRLSSRFPSSSSKDATYPDDITNEAGMRNRALSRNASKAHRGSARFDSSMSMRRGGGSARMDYEYEDDDDDDDDDDKSEDEENESEECGEGGEDSKEEEEEPVKMSLMSLLAESEGSSYMMGEGEDEDEDDGDVIGGDHNLNNCCVCQVRHKGAAFVPCGHSFCRLCSKELWVEGGNCPLCNNFILEILDIF